MWLNKFRNILGLSFQLAKTNFKLRNEGSYLGIFWYLLSPLLLFLILIAVSKFVNIFNEEYPIYLLIGLVVFNFFMHSVIQSSNAITFNSHIIKSMKISQESLVIATVFQATLSHFFEIILLITVLIFYKFSLIGMIFYPIILFFFIIFVMGVAFVLATLGVFVSDLNNVLNVLLTSLWFATPIFYFIDKTSFLYNVNLFNPIFYFIEITRQVVLYNKTPDLLMVITIILFSFFIFVFGVSVFGKFKNKFAELL